MYKFASCKAVLNQESAVGPLGALLDLNIVVSECLERLRIGGLVKAWSTPHRPSSVTAYIF